jgi:hypothetical protein
VPDDDALLRLIRDSEESLLDRRVRKTAGILRRMLAEDFVEFGSSGRVFDRAAAIEELAGEADVAFATSDFHVARLAPDVMLATYRSTTSMPGESEPRRSLRSSIWIHRAGRWQILFHQGTPTDARPKEQA